MSLPSWAGSLGATRKVGMVISYKAPLWLLASFLIIGGFAVAQAPQRQTPQKYLVAADLEKQAAVRSLEQTIMQAAAEKLRQQKTPTNSVELRVTVRTSSDPHNCSVCVGSPPLLKCMQLLSNTE